jgi:Tfp pilus assembly protein PilF
LSESRIKSIAVIIAAVVILAGCQKPQSKDELLTEGLKLVGENNSRGAIVLFKDALEKDENFYQARFQLAKAYYKTEKFDAAEKELQKVIRRTPASGRLSTSRGPTAEEHA